MTHRWPFSVAGWVVLLTLALPPHGQAQQGLPVSSRAIQSFCNDRVRAGADVDFANCSSREQTRLRERMVLCAKQMQMQDVRTADQPAFMERCLAAADFQQFQQAQIERSQAEGKKLGRPFEVPPHTLQVWANFDGKVVVRLRRVLVAQWVGGFESGNPHGQGELLAEVEYVKGVLVEKSFVGTVHLTGTMIDGQFTGPVHALQHVAWDDSNDKATENEFAAGRNLGLPVETQCDPAGLASGNGHSARFFGVCPSGKPYHGLAILEYNNQPYDLVCINRGTAAERGELEAFKPCESFWRALPGYCNVGDFNGQCQAGRPSGVGVVVTVKTSQGVNRGGGVLAAMPNLLSPGIRSYYVQRGMFADGQLAGFGYSGLMENCGMAGCSGDRSEQVGWFDAGKVRFACASPDACVANLSGRDYLRMTKARSGQAGTQAAASAAPSTTLAALEAFHASGERQDLRLASQLARTSAEHGAVEFELIRIAGYDKVFLTSAELVAGPGKSVDFSQQDKFLGFVRNTESQVPLRVNWQLRHDRDAVNIKHAAYMVRALIGVRIRMKRSVCFGNACRDEFYTDVFERAVDVRFEVGAREHRGQFDLRQSMNSASVMFGAPMTSALVDVEPYAKVESVRSLQ